MRVTRRIPEVIGIAILLSLFLACSNPISPGIGTILLTITDEMAAPVQGAAVTLLSTEELQDTDDSGRALFTRVGFGTHPFTITGRDIDLTFGSVTVTEGDTTSQVVQVPRGRGSLEIMVHDRESLHSLPGLDLLITRVSNDELICSCTTDSNGQAYPPALPCDRLLISAVDCLPYAPTAVEVSVPRDTVERVPILMDLIRTVVSGELRFSSEVHLTTGNMVGLLGATEIDGEYTFVADPVLFPTRFYNLSTPFHGYVSAVAFGNDSPFEFAVVLSEIYDCRSNARIIEEVNMAGWITQAAPSDFTRYSSSRDQLSFNCRRSPADVWYCEWQIWMWDQDTAGNWRYALIYYADIWGFPRTFSWRLTNQDGDRVSPPPEGTFFSWNIVELVGDGGLRGTGDYFFVLASGYPRSTAATSARPAELVETARGSVYDRIQDTVRKRGFSLGSRDQ